MEKYLDDSFLFVFSSKTSMLSRLIKTSNDDNEFRVNQHARRIFVYSLPVELIGIDMASISLKQSSHRYTNFTIPTTGRPYSYFI